MNSNDIFSFGSGFFWGTFLAHSSIFFRACCMVQIFKSSEDKIYFIVVVVVVAVVVVGTWQLFREVLRQK